MNRITPSPVGASLLAIDVNDDAGCLDERSALACIASRLAPTGAVCKLSQSRPDKRGWRDMFAHWPGSQPWIDCPVWGGRTD
ncbi:hypothetical protein DBR45_06925 [Pseudomonas sp. HMWF031]|nr:hypothetical protein DBR45_06925 [Pseudomonas sp. HMWF031]